MNEKYFGVHKICSLTTKDYSYLIYSCKQMFTSLEKFDIHGNEFGSLR